MKRKIVSVITIIALLIASSNVVYAKAPPPRSRQYNIEPGGTYDATSRGAELREGDVILYSPGNSNEEEGESAVVKLPPGKYQIECWGSEGGDSFSIASLFGDYNIQQGNGGYASAVYDVVDEGRLYLYPGGDGVTDEFGGVLLAITAVVSVLSIVTFGAAALLTLVLPILTSFMVIPSINAGYNGGGHGDIYKGLIVGYYTGGGGGATHVALSPGVLSSHSRDYKSKVLMAAGGGSGSTSIITIGDLINEILEFNASKRTNSNGYLGCGGGESGYPAMSDIKAMGYEYTRADLKKWGYYAGLGGTQTEGGESVGGKRGSFGQGANGYADGEAVSPGAGGGLYGGGTCPSGEVGTSGGGSGYINESLVSDGKLIAGNKSMPSVSGGNEMGHAARGAIKITVLKLDDGCQNVLYSPNIVPLGEKFTVRSENTYNMNMLKIRRVSYLLKGEDGTELSKATATLGSRTRKSLLETGNYSGELSTPRDADAREGTLVMTVEYDNGRVETISKPIMISVVETEKVEGPRYIGNGSLPNNDSRWSTDDELKRQLIDSLGRKEPMDSIKLE